MTKRYLQFRNWRTNDAMPPIDITNRNEREIEKIESGMLRNCDVEAGWFVDDTAEPASCDRSGEAGETGNTVSTEGESAVGSEADETPKTSQSVNPEPPQQ